MTPSGRVSVTSTFAPGANPEADRTKVSPWWPGFGLNEADGFSAGCPLVDGWPVDGAGVRGEPVVGGGVGVPLVYGPSCEKSIPAGCVKYLPLLGS